jgi:hypothetical protein
MKKAVTNARSSFANLKANRSEDRKSTCVTGQVTLQGSARRVRPLAIEPHNKKESLGVRIVSQTPIRQRPVGLCIRN